MLRVDRRGDVLIALYRQAEQRVRLLITNALQANDLSLGGLLADRLTEIQQVLADLQATAIPEATQIITDGYMDGVSLIRNPQDLTGIHGTAIELLADTLTTRLNDAAETIAHTADELLRREVVRQSALKLIERSTTREATTALAGALRDQGLHAFQDRAGRAWSLERYAQMAVRTTTRDAVSRGTVTRMAEVGEEFVTWVARPDVDDDPCRERHGRTYSISGRSVGHQILESLPPAHPNCMCVLWPQPVAAAYLQDSTLPVIAVADTQSTAVPVAA